MADIFISYARDDRSKAQLLAQAFEQHNWSVWWDTRLQAGEVWDEAIERELNAAKCVVVLWSKTSVARRWVRAEANDGLQRGILFPVLLEHIQPPLASRLVQAESLVGWAGESSHSGLDRLLAAIEHFLRQQEQRGTATEQKDEESNEPPRPPPRQVGRRKRWMVALLGTGTLAAAVGVAVYEGGKEGPSMPPSPSTTQGTSGTSTTPNKPVVEPDQPKAKAIAQEIAGNYHVTGKNPDGTSYYGEANIKREDGRYEIMWMIGNNQRFYGAGLASGGTLTVKWDGGIVIYDIQKDGKLEGHWADGKASETLIPK